MGLEDVDGCDGSENLLVVILQSSTVLAQYEKGRNETNLLCIKLLSYATCKSNDVDARLLAGQKLQWT